MPVWLVRVTWIEDEVEASEQWEVSADTAHEAVKQVSMNLRYQPHHVEARRTSPKNEGQARAGDLPHGQMRRIPPQ